MYKSYHTQEQKQSEAIRYLAYLSAKTADKEGLEHAIGQGWHPHLDMGRAPGDYDGKQMGLQVICSDASVSEKLNYLELLCNGTGSFSPISIDSIRDKEGNTLFMAAASYRNMSGKKDWQYDYKRLLDGLVKLGANKDAQNDNGFTALYLNTVNNFSENVTELLNMGCNPQIKSNFGITPAEEAHERGYRRIECDLKIFSISKIKALNKSVSRI